ncbi:tetratricopeptide repeat protein [Proteocatella sphenisci]|uniref:tetratricopeptide repeat protein n=1 Tax=Proteocatella sphenisci TaxID=181070 RepID=UPI0004914E1C|nr:tetratricopeptide repeat protein [Proteocatella sphenisci]
MRSNLDNFFLSLTDKLVFIEIEDKNILRRFGDTDSEFMVPVFSKDIVKMATDDDAGVSTLQIAEAILYLLGADSQFKYNPQYVNFINTNIEKPEILVSSLAKKKYENRNYIDALAFLRAGMLLSDENTDIIYNYAHICKEYLAQVEDKELKNLLFKESQEFFEAVLDLDEDNFLANYQLSFFKINQGEIDDAMEHLKKVALNTDDGEIAQEAENLIMKLNTGEMIEKVEAYVDEMKLEEALDILEEMQEITEDKDLMYRMNYAKGFCYKAFSEFEEAIEAYEKALLVNNTDTLLLCELGICYAYIGDFDQALEFYMSALDIEPKSTEILSNIAVVYLNMKDLTNAKLYIKKAMEIDPHDEIIESTLKVIRTIEETEQ